MTRRVTLRSLAKINLDLRVLHQNPDGFHELRTVFQTISLADTIEVEFEKSRRTELSIDDPDAIPDNLILRAAKAVLEAMGIAARVHFRLTKRIPMGGGLGGGSSNAAAVLLALPVLGGASFAHGNAPSNCLVSGQRTCPSSCWEERRWGLAAEPSSIRCRISRRNRCCL